MKKSILIGVILSILLISVSSCHKDVRYGTVVFWFPANYGNGTVSIGGHTGTITGYVTGGVPDCGNSVCATFYLPQGTYTYNASADNGYGWVNKTALVYPDQCQAYELQ